jgi:hypothetical protein
MATIVSMMATATQISVRDMRRIPRSAKGSSYPIWNSGFPKRFPGDGELTNVQFSMFNPGRGFDFPIPGLNIEH